MIKPLYHIRNSNVKVYSTCELNWTNEPVMVLGLVITHGLHELIQLNLDPVIENITSLLKIWQSRDLSLIGNPVQVHKLTLLPVFCSVICIRSQGNIIHVSNQ